jgi:hypothetical protein
MLAHMLMHQWGREAVNALVVSFCLSTVAAAFAFDFGNNSRVV